MKYKLIKEYPGSPKLGFILPFGEKTNQYRKDKWNYTIHEIENNSEFWQKLEPLFVTEDGKNKYVGMKLGWFVDENNCINYSNVILKETFTCITKYKYFSTKKAAQNYIDKKEIENEPKFKKGKWYECEGDYMFYQGNHKDYGFCNDDWKPADMDKVEELLLKKAKKDYKNGDKYKMKGYRYFVSYNFINDDESSGIGNGSFVSDTKIKSYDDIKTIEKTIINNTKFKSITIINYILLNKEEIKLHKNKKL